MWLEKQKKLENVIFFLPSPIPTPLITTIQQQPIGLSAPFDVEGHRGRDGRYYLLDFSRTMPPEKKNRLVCPGSCGGGCAHFFHFFFIFFFFILSRNFRGGILFQLLRPEFVIRYVKHRNMVFFPSFFPSHFPLSVFLFFFLTSPFQPLCPDTYSPPVPPPDRKQHEQEVEMVCCC